MTEMISASKLKRKTVKSLVRVLMFLDFLDDVPQKVVRSVLRIFLYFIVLLSILYIVLNPKAVVDLRTSIEYYFFPSYKRNLFVVGNPTSDLPQKVRGIPFPIVTARAILAVDVKTEYVLYSQNAYEELSPASTTKLMTALVARDAYNLDEFLEVNELCTEIESQKSGYVPGELVRVRDLIYTLLINSAGDAACILAFGEGSYSSYVKQMNSLARKLGLNNTHFTNPIGLDDTSHYSSAYDLFRLAKTSVQDPVIRDAVATKEYATISGTYSRFTYNTNRLLWDVPGSVGIKTGRTEGAGEVLIYQYKSGEIDVIIVVMGSEDRFTDTQQVLQWLLSSYSF